MARQTYSITTGIENIVEQAAGKFLQSEGIIEAARIRSKALFDTECVASEAPFLDSLALYAEAATEIGLDKARPREKVRAIKLPLIEAGLSEKQVKVLHENSVRWIRNEKVRGFLGSDSSEKNQRAAFEALLDDQTRNGLIRFVGKEKVSISAKIAALAAPVARFFFTLTGEVVSAEQIETFSKAVVKHSKRLAKQAEKKAAEKAAKQAEKEAAKQAA